MASSIARRTFITRFSAVGTALSTGGVLLPTVSFGADRPELSRSRSGVSCDNANIAVSSITDRKATPAGFDAAGTCRMTRSAVEGPYFICSDAATAKDISGGQAGIPLTLALRVQDKNCNPIPGAIVDVWNCNAVGEYSGFAADPDEEFRGGLVEMSLASRFLRGVLATDADGIVEFDTIYPGYYAGRAIHIHFKVHVGNRAYLTSQALFPEEINSRVLQTAPYNGPRGTRRLLNAEDPGFIGDLDTFSMSEHGSQLLATLNLVLG